MSMSVARSTLDPWLREHLVCPRDERPLVEGSAALTCAGGHSYPCVDGIPVMLLDDLPETHWMASYSVEHLRDPPPPLPPDGIDPFVREALGATCGNLYADAGRRITAYPIPRFPFEPQREGESLLDIGCNWGRWSISASRRGFHVVGIDPSLPGIHAARRVSAQLGAHAVFVVGDARRLPFRRGTFAAIFSYSVLQHFSPADFCASLEEAGRVLARDGRAAVQMPNKFGVRNLFQQARRGFAVPQHFEVRYWSTTDLLHEFARHIGPARLQVDGYFSLNPQISDVDVLPRRYRPIVRLSERLRRASEKYGFLLHAADSVYVHAIRNAG